MLSFSIPSLIPAQNADPHPELDAYWSQVSKTVAEGDFAGYGALYHPDAVLANETQAKSYPIATALEGWKSGFDDTKAGRIKASVSFRFTQRLNDETTAHETGIFHYAAIADDGKVSESYVHFQALLVKKSEWLMLMEYQKSTASLKEWNAAE